MHKTDVAFAEHLEQVYQVMTSRGLLLASCDGSGKPNVMTIGWGSLGSVWDIPVWLVLVRPSRYTFRLIEQTGQFTVNVPPRQLEQACSHCGTVSGRNHDKFAEANLTPTPARMLACPIIDQCVINYECRVVHKNDVIASQLANSIQTSAYPANDYHRIYWGQVLAAYADLEALDTL